LGVDVLEHEALALRDEGFDVRVHDLTVEPLAERFDVIVAGEVIEHVGAPERLLANCRRMLDDSDR
jgi:2-polyprenyl-3-methyl-5-hydroxy-6-metoxy-1,4-benzoquinol methylase